MRTPTVYEVSIMTLQKIDALLAEISRTENLLRAAHYIDHNKVPLIRTNYFRGTLKPIEKVISEDFGVSLKDAKALLVQRVDKFTESDFK